MVMHQDHVCPHCGRVEGHTAHDANHFDEAEAVRVLAQRHPEIDWAEKARTAPGFVQGAYLQIRHSDEMLDAVASTPRADERAVKRNTRRARDMKRLPTDPLAYLTPEEAKLPRGQQPQPHVLRERRDAALDRRVK
jgi:hypothetical protein